MIHCPPQVNFYPVDLFKVDMPEHLKQQQIVEALKQSVFLCILYENLKHTYCFTDVSSCMNAIILHIFFYFYQYSLKLSKRQ